VPSGILRDYDVPCSLVRESEEIRVVVLFRWIHPVLRVILLTFSVAKDSVRNSQTGQIAVRYPVKRVA
jgi:hypothetical protein